jgi:hypothetical protein
MIIYHFNHITKYIPGRQCINVQLVDQITDREASQKDTDGSHVVEVMAVLLSRRKCHVVPIFITFVEIQFCSK